MPEYNAKNEKLKKQYEEALIHGAYREKSTVDSVWKSLNLFEDFTAKKDFSSFNVDQAIGFKKWLEKRKNAKGQPLSISTVRSILKNIRDFFQWLVLYPKIGRNVDGRAISYLRLSNNDERASRAVRDTPVPTFDEIRSILEKMPYDTDVEKRDRAIVAFSALTAVRVDALITLKIKHIDMNKKEVWQNPRDVNTKGRKGINTMFMTFDPLWEKIFTDYYHHITCTLGFNENDALFPKTLLENNPKTLSFEVKGLSREHWAEGQPIREIYRKAFNSAGLRYYTPHSFRNSIVKWAMENCSQYQFKAISQNIAHEHVMTTYNAYGKLNIHEQRKAVQSISENTSELQAVSNEDLIAELSRRTHK